MSKILVTGGAGFIGYNISRILSDCPSNEVHIVDDLTKGEKDNEFIELLERRNVTFYERDLTDVHTYDEIDTEYNHIYHLAALVGVKNVTDNPDLTIRVNALSTIHLLDHISRMVERTSPKILFASSCENYAGSIKCCDIPIPTPEDVPLCIEDVYNPRWSYAASKILGEMACIHYSKKRGFFTTVVRYHNIYGPRMGLNHVIPEFILRLKKNPHELEMFGGYQYRSFCYVTDAAKMTINLMNNVNSNNKIVNVGDDRECVKIASVGERLSQIMNINPKFLERGAPIGSTERRLPDLSILKNMACYVSEVSLSQGLTNTCKWYDERYN